jgi:glutamate--cysteine ligase catalytic subunit
LHALKQQRNQVDRYNDLVRPLDAWSLETLLAAGVDAPLARHVAHLFVRDPLVLFDGLIEEVRIEEVEDEASVVGPG